MPHTEPCSTLEMGHRAQETDGALPISSPHPATPRGVGRSPHKWPGPFPPPRTRLQVAPGHFPHGGDTQLSVTAESRVCTAPGLPSSAWRCGDTGCAPGRVLWRKTAPSGCGCFPEESGEVRAAGGHQLSVSTLAQSSLCKQKPRQRYRLFSISL